jgi:hypothetical protein
MLYLWEGNHWCVTWMQTTLKEHHAMDEKIPFKGSQISPWQPYNCKWRFTIVVPMRIGNIAIDLFLNQIGPNCTNLKYKMLVKGLWRLFTRTCLIHKIIGLQSLARNLMEWWKDVLKNDYFKMAQWRMEKVKKWYKVLQEVLVDGLYMVNVHIQFDHVKLLVYVSIS